MATQISMLKGSNATDVLSREVPTAIHTALTAFGWIQTPDTGQINLATHLLGAADYMIFRMADALQATVPVFAKFIFGGNASAGTIKVQLGQATNGAGTLTGIVTDVVSYGTATYFNASGGTPDVDGNYPWYFSGSTNRFCMVGNHKTGNVSRCPNIISIERLKESDGTDKDTGAFLMTDGDGVNINSLVLPASGAVPTVENGVKIFMPPAPTIGSISAGVVLYPKYPWNVAMLNPLRNIFAITDGILPDETVEPHSIYGLSQNIRVIRNHKVIGDQSTSDIAMRWE